MSKKDLSKVNIHQEQYWRNYYEGEILGFDGFKKFVNRVDIAIADLIIDIINSEGKEKVAIGDFGCGKGDICSYYLPTITNVFSFHAYDINHINTWDAIRNTSEAVKHIAGECKFACKNLNEFTPRNKFNYIICLNSFYGINFNRINRFQKNLKENGKMLIVLNSEECFNIQFARAGHAQEVVSSYDLENYLVANNIKHRTHQVKYKTTREEVLACDDLFKYLLRCEKFDKSKIGQAVNKISDQFFNLNQKLFVISK